MNNFLKIMFVLELHEDSNITLFEVECRDWDNSKIDELFAKQAIYKIIPETSYIENLISQNKASLWAISKNSNHKLLLAAYDSEQSNSKNIFWKGRKSTLDYFGVIEFKYDH